MNIKNIINKLESNSISVYVDENSGKIDGYDLSTYTDGGVNQSIFIDFRNTGKNPKSAKDFLELYNERVNDIDIDEEIDLNRQNKQYKADFTISESVKDFEDWKKTMQSIFSNEIVTEKQIVKETISSLNKKGLLNKVAIKNYIKNKI